MATMMIIKQIPLIISTIFKHFTRGPPQPSWSLKKHLASNLFRNLIFINRSYTIEVLQSGSPLIKNFKDPHVKIDKIIISNEYRLNAQEYIEKLVKPYAIAINPIWKSPKNDGINCEITMNKDWNFNNQENDWEKEKIVIYFH